MPMRDVAWGTNRSCPWTWIGHVNNIDQKLNAFFQRNADANLPVGAVSVVP
jgi:hypothetical protein